ncbi:MAG: hypothetical protein BJ554DRAFT_6940 [Olpidium bornovanus]|uniref:Uncharacterized protein n=1 Tax=Olpidium bornovanus TaxID=278681 RepID=A0A8H7ZWY6_9FUNG|nr:MAG: hypothetical protein BJ554DRAFT_6940 [Olpidium bornovanus]
MRHWGCGARPFGQEEAAICTRRSPKSVLGAFPAPQYVAPFARLGLSRFKMGAQIKKTFAHMPAENEGTCKLCPAVVLQHDTWIPEQIP